MISSLLVLPPSVDVLFFSITTVTPEESTLTLLLHSNLSALRHPNVQQPWIPMGNYITSAINDGYDALPVPVLGVWKEDEK